ncbi:MAG: AmmeMemoRadiSam system radical SAM enzyme [Deltaproteobacteria bacterium]|nr:AmmeMemoRadiSam system radical SAM enzyme [Deltaproteobacteria bacterium]
MRDLPTVREAILYESLKGENVRCGLCERRCLIPPDERGFCQTRQNIEGKLYTLVFGAISALESRPIEIKPFFHFYPGSSALTFSTWSCNFTCPWCQNWHLSKRAPKPKGARYISPEQMVTLAREQGDQGLCVSFQEPTLLFEYALEVFKLGKAQGLYGCYVSNGYLTLDALRLLKEAGMGAINIDIKGDAELYRVYLKGAKEEVVWRNARVAKEMGIHVEMIHLVVTGLNDQRDKIERLIQKHLGTLGPETPLHFTRYLPAYHYHQPPTEIKIMEFAYETARDTGIYYPYLGNISGHRYENTYCPSCGALFVERIGYQIRGGWAKDKRCPHCGREIEIIV